MLSNTSLNRIDVTTLYSVFKSRVDTSPKDEAFRFFDVHSQSWQSINWIEAYQELIKVRNALATKKLKCGDRILLAIENSPSWVYIEQAALYLGLVVVALPPGLPPGHVSELVAEVDAKLLFIQSDNIWQALQSSSYFQKNFIPVICTTQCADDIQSAIYFEHWINEKQENNSNELLPTINENDLATIIFTSGSCGKPKGVKHSHKNIINNAFSCLNRIEVTSHDKMLSVTPISHCMERIAGYYVPMIAGACIVFPKSTESILEDLAESKATILVTTPHRLEKAYKRLLNNLLISATLVDQYLEYLNHSGKWRLKFLFWPILRGIIENKAKKLLLHQLKFVISGGSSLSPKIISLSHLLNLPVLQGYGLTEAGGVVATNSIKQNIPFSVGRVLDNTQVRLSKDNELLIQSDSLMLGYWNDGKQNLKPKFWLPTGDLVRQENSYLFIEGRKNQTIHLSTGFAVLPFPFEQCLVQDILFENVFIFGENKEYLVLFCQLNLNSWGKFHYEYAKSKERDSDTFTKRLKSILLIRVNAILQKTSGHPHIHRIFPTLEPWSEENGLLNTQGKINRLALEKYYSDEIRSLE